LIKLRQLADERRAHVECRRTRSICPLISSHLSVTKRSDAPLPYAVATDAGSLTAELRIGYFIYRPAETVAVHSASFRSHDLDKNCKKSALYTPAEAIGSSDAAGRPSQALGWRTGAIIAMLLADFKCFQCAHFKTIYFKILFR
jgi:hypothetical protein